jgi:hypothetical protein
MSSAHASGYGYGSAAEEPGAGADASAGGAGSAVDVNPGGFPFTVALLAEHQVRGDPPPFAATNPTLAFDREQPRLLAQHLASAAEPTVALALRAAHALLGQHETAWRLQAEGLLDVLGELAAPPPDSSSARFSKETQRSALSCLEKM